MGEQVQEATPPRLQPRPPAGTSHRLRHSARPRSQPVRPPGPRLSVALRGPHLGAMLREPDVCAAGCCELSLGAPDRPAELWPPRGPGRDTAALGAAPPSPAVGSAQYLPAPSRRSRAPHPQLTQCPALSSYPQRTVLPGLFAVGSVYCTRGCMVTPGQTSAPADPSGAAAGRLAAFPARLEGPREREDSCRAPWSPFP